MYKLAILFSFFLFASGAVFRLPDLSKLDDNDVSEEPPKRSIKFDLGKRKDIWVLQLNEDGLDLQMLRIADQKEEEIFERVVGPMIDAYNYRPARVVKKVPAIENATCKDTREVNERINKRIKQEIMRLINKFAMTMKSDPDAFISDSASGETDGPSLNLYLKGAFTSLTVTSDRKEWHYFIPPPSPLPAWLYDPRDPSEEIVEIPDDVRDQLYEKLLHLLKLFLSFPV